MEKAMNTQQYTIIPATSPGYRMASGARIYLKSVSDLIIEPVIAWAVLQNPDIVSHCTFLDTLLPLTPGGWPSRTTPWCVIAPDGELVGFSDSVEFRAENLEGFLENCARWHQDRAAERREHQAA